MRIASYHNKLCSADVAVEAIKSHDRIFMTGNCSVPKELLGALVRRAPELEDIEIVQVLTIGPAEYVEASETWQFDDYSKYAADMFDVEARLKRHLEVFPEDCKKAYEMGRRLASAQ